MKILYGKQQSEIERMQKLAASGLLASADGSGAAASMGGAPQAADGEGVGEVNLGPRGFALGHAPDHEAPSGGLAEPPAFQKLDAEQGDGGAEGAPTSAYAAPRGGVTAAGLGRRDAYATFKGSEGAELNESLVAAKKALKSKRSSRQKLAEKINREKSTIDTSKAALERKVVERVETGAGADVDIIDEEEYAIIQTLKAAKKAYKATHDEMRRASDELRALEADVDAARKGLVAAFEGWYALSFSPDDEPPDAPPVAPPPAAAPDKEFMDEDEQFQQLQDQRGDQP
jgi:hypothetical protein